MAVDLGTLRRIVCELAAEISLASEAGELMSPVAQAVMRARDALADALAAAGEAEEATRGRHLTIDELLAMRIRTIDEPQGGEPPDGASP